MRNITKSKWNVPLCVACDLEPTYKRVYGKSSNFQAISRDFLRDTFIRNNQYFLFEQNLIIYTKFKPTCLLGMV